MSKILNISMSLCYSSQLRTGGACQGRDSRTSSNIGQQLLQIIKDALFALFQLSLHSFRAYDDINFFPALKPGSMKSISPSWRHLSRCNSPIPLFKSKVCVHTPQVTSPANFQGSEFNSTKSSSSGLLLLKSSHLRHLFN